MLKMDNQEFLFAKNDFDLENIRCRLIKCVCELQSRRNEVTSLKSALDEANRGKAGLEQDVKNFERETIDLRDQLKIALDALNQKDSIRTGFLENAARQNVQLEAMTNDHDRLNAKLQSTQFKILELTRDNNKLQEQLKVLQAARNQPVESADRIWKAMDALNGHLQNLEVEHVALTQTAESSNKIAEEASIAMMNCQNDMKILQDMNTGLRKRILGLESRIVTMQTSSPICVQNNTGTDSKFEEQIVTLTTELEAERAVNNELKINLASLLTLQECLNKQLNGNVQPSEVSQVQPDNVTENNPMETE